LNDAMVHRTRAKEWVIKDGQRIIDGPAGYVGTALDRLASSRAVKTSFTIDSDNVCRPVRTWWARREDGARPNTAGPSRCG
jgi:cysteine synthase